uniref:uncharacterized protein LOC101301301 isoform X2 n=1 Tax=Fragaria vesca subsp. vesca TaxID=101020 RepID=UPI0005CA0ECE|nr:PREDICTED: uncharacterized protein LOC101301301 isoform X2 [Fragaria vesca subsp. vesca]
MIPYRCSQLQLHVAIHLFLSHVKKSRTLLITYAMMTKAFLLVGSSTVRGVNKLNVPKPQKSMWEQILVRAYVGPVISKEISNRLMLAGSTSERLVLFVLVVSSILAWRGINFPTSQSS